ncbi:MAG TPA: thiamine pyrophosphate-dependent dehydrogenase E1 component subunit alpha [Blastocatellia bacterium]|jgi:pyruvate dehydrogenase E1 component alpha subunit/2-oxoisovalerate dehydrogenase E1 component alpha subunit|nr:thiamine pyrophosphate-dependent dehydrogenase E1 component subunit alpha [Blastocatellia bacterium]
MIRYQAFDPPEYLNWKPEPEVTEFYERTIEENPERRAIIHSLNPAQLIALYEGLVRNRLHDVALKRWVKQGVLSKAWLGTGEEAATIGPVHALDRSPYEGGSPTDFVAPMIRNAGACHEMGMSLDAMLRGYLGTEDSPARGRDLHIGDFSHGVIAPISHVGDIMAVAAGIALSFKMKRQRRVALTWIGDGSTKSGVFHESMNFAAVQRLPLVVIIQDNKVALGTRLEQHHRGSFLDWPEAYGVEGAAFDGNNVLDAYAAVKVASDKCREGLGPCLLIAETFRMGGHATHDEREARATFDAQLFEHWGKRDPIGLFENYLIEGALDLETGRRMKQTAVIRELNAEILRRAEQRVIKEIERATEEALESLRTNMPRPDSAPEGVYADAESFNGGQPAPGVNPKADGRSNALSLKDAS